MADGWSDGWREGRVAIFAKAAIAGRVKTRIAARSSADFAASLHAAFVADLVARLTGEGGPGGVEIHSDIEWDGWAGLGVPVRLQAEGDLGRRMLVALAAMLDAGVERAMILGADAPSVPLGALCELMRADADVALGPAMDGGFYAIAARRVDARMFEGVRWSAATTLEETEAALMRCGLRAHRGPLWYDLDEIEDLLRFSDDLLLLPNTMQVIKIQNYFRLF
jgi:glycosyltransferase A (GT-A) superfamily protein (DUF2064 family)